jgi:hypothetical protein
VEGVQYHKVSLVGFVVLLSLGGVCQLHADQQTGPSGRRVSLLQPDSLTGWAGDQPKWELPTIAAGVMLITERTPVHSARDDFGTFALTFDARGARGARAVLQLFGRSTGVYGQGYAYVMPLFPSGMPEKE